MYHNKRAVQDNSLHKFNIFIRYQAFRVTVTAHRWLTASETWKYQRHSTLREPFSRISIYVPPFRLNTLRTHIYLLAQVEQAHWPLGQAQAELGPQELRVIEANVSIQGL